MTPLSGSELRCWSQALPVILLSAILRHHYFLLCFSRFILSLESTCFLLSWEVFPIASGIWSLGPWLVALHGDFTEPLGGGVLLLGEVSHQGQGWELIASPQFHFALCFVFAAENVIFSRLLHPPHLLFAAVPLCCGGPLFLCSSKLKKRFLWMTLVMVFYHNIIIIKSN